MNTGNTRKTIRLYNILLPVWMMILLPTPLWFFIIPADFAIDLLVLWILLKRQKVENYPSVIKRTILPVGLIGFGADIIGAALLILPFFNDHFADTDTASCIMMDPFGDIFAFLIILAAIAVSGVIIYFADLWILKRNIHLTLEQAKHTALWLAVITAPYSFLFPSKFLYGSGF